MKVEELTKKIYEEGIEKAQKLEKEALEKAQSEADRILTEARREAEQVAERAKRDAENAKAVLARELKLAGDLALGQVKRRIADCLVDAVLPDSVAEALSGTDFMRELILEVVRHWDQGQTNIDIEVVLPSNAKERVAAQFALRAKELLDRGLELSFSDELRGGFRIQPKDGSYRVSFDEESFAAFFREFLRERTRAVLFPDDDSGTDRGSPDRAGQQA